MKLTKEFYTHPLYSVWCGMKNRCNNKKSHNFKHYGEKGISICNEWRNDFKNFYYFCLANGWKKGLTIDRVENDKGYYHENCRFVTSRINNLNRGKKKTNKSGYVGVCYYKHVQQWGAQITIRYVQTNLGCYKTKEDAVKGRNQYIIDNNLEHEYKVQEVIK